MQSKNTYDKRIAERLDYLRMVSCEDQEPFSESSIGQFLTFWSNNPDLELPSLVVTFDGMLRAEWKISADEYFAVVFFEHGLARYVAYKTSADDPSKTGWSADITTIDNLMAVWP